MARVSSSHNLSSRPTDTKRLIAPFSALFECVKDLGLGETRAQRLVEISQIFLSNPPMLGRLYPSRGKTTILGMVLNHDNFEFNAQSL